MEKPLYNQGDLLYYRRYGTRSSGHPVRFKTHLLVITKVFAVAEDLYYRIRWARTGEKETYHIGSLDDSEYFTLMARGQ